MSAASAPRRGGEGVSGGGGGVVPVPAKYYRYVPAIVTYFLNLWLKFQSKINIVHLHLKPMLPYLNTAGGQDRYSQPERHAPSTPTDPPSAILAPRQLDMYTRIIHETLCISQCCESFAVTCTHMFEDRQAGSSGLCAKARLKLVVKPCKMIGWFREQGVPGTARGAQKGGHRTIQSRMEWSLQ